MKVRAKIPQGTECGNLQNEHSSCIRLATEPSQLAELFLISFHSLWTLYFSVYAFSWCQTKYICALACLKSSYVIASCVWHHQIKRQQKHQSKPYLFGAP
eukprot:scaffold32192_cov37-Prasinocladus_malaysianus.AAC.1